MTSDKRAFHRIFYPADAVLSCDGSMWPCRLVDLSLQGCLLRFDHAWQENPEKIYTLTLNLSDEISITMALSLSHVIGNNAGFKCEHIDIDSITTLRRLVELNLGDSDLLERDLLALTEER
ncbi:MAG: PilZ domain-containing protein [Gammaproteobacteria bacterium HGW-Gammaproteobacteria-3]|nr:MAG: PilZ domain-containing protein [Gammaproteobacteria bacterium HGW-Gammaproteobacteria-3]